MVHKILRYTNTRAHTSLAWSPFVVVQSIFFSVLSFLAMKPIRPIRGASGLSVHNIRRGRVPVFWKAGLSNSRLKKKIQPNPSFSLQNSACRSPARAKRAGEPASASMTRKHRRAKQVRCTHLRSLQEQNHNIHQAAFVPSVSARGTWQSEPRSGAARQSFIAVSN